MADKKSPWIARLQRLRKRLGLSQAAAAERIGVARATWIAWEHGDRYPSAAAQKLIELLESGRI